MCFSRAHSSGTFPSRWSCWSQAWSVWSMEIWTRQSPTPARMITLKTVFPQRTGRAGQSESVAVPQAQTAAGQVRDRGGRPAPDRYRGAHGRGACQPSARKGGGESIQAAAHPDRLGCWLPFKYALRLCYPIFNLSLHTGLARLRGQIFSTEVNVMKNYVMTKTIRKRFAGSSSAL